MVAKDEISDTYLKFIFKNEIIVELFPTEPREYKYYNTLIPKSII